ncbi:MAG: MCP four helix bundle domain-containing protein [Candidatus Nitrosopolaris sp.]
MRLRSFLILLFILVALIPILTLSVISVYSISRLQEQISNVYYGALLIQVGLNDGNAQLLQMRLNVQRYIVADNATEKHSLLTNIQQTEDKFLQTLFNYKRITDFPIQIVILNNRGQGYLIPYEAQLVNQVHKNWQDYRTERDTTLALSNENRPADAIKEFDGPEANKFDQLLITYNKIVDLNTQIAKIMYDESIFVVQEAILFDVVASAASACAAITAAILLSKKLTPSLAEIERNAKKQIEKFVKKSSGVLTQKEVSSSINNGQNSSDPAIEIGEAQGPLMLLNSSAYQNREEELSRSSHILDSFLSTTTGDKNSLVVMTRKGSNLYYKVKNRAGVLIYILSASAQSPLHTSEEGLLVISLNQTSLLLEAARRTLEENPSATFILDNATEFIHSLGFEKAFSLIRNISELASSYPRSHIVVLINTRAHERSAVESIASLANVFIEY